MYVIFCAFTIPRRVLILTYVSSKMIGQLGPGGANLSYTLHQQCTSKSHKYIEKHKQIVRSGNQRPTPKNKKCIEKQKQIVRSGNHRLTSTNNKCIEQKQAFCAIWESPLVAQNQQMPVKNSHKCYSQNQNHRITKETHMSIYRPVTISFCCEIVHNFNVN